MPIVDGRQFASEEEAEDWVKDWELVYGIRLDIDEDLPKGRAFGKAIYGSEIVVDLEGKVITYTAAWLWPETLGLAKAGPLHWLFRCDATYQSDAERLLKKAWASRNQG